MTFLGLEDTFSTLTFALIFTALLYFSPNVYLEIIITMIFLYINSLNLENSLAIYLIGGVFVGFIIEAIDIKNRERINRLRIKKKIL